MADLNNIQAAGSTIIVGSDATGAETNAVSADSNGNLNTINPSDGPVTPGTAAVNASLTAGQFNTVLPTLTATQQAAIQLDSSGRQIIAPLTSASITTAAEDHNFGTVGANTLRTAAQIGNATGAADFNAGTTGAQTLRTSANLRDEDGVPYSSTNVLPVEDTFTSKFRVEILTTPISIPTAIYTNVYSYTGSGRLIGFSIEFNSVDIIVRVQVDGETVLDGASMATLSTFLVTIDEKIRRQNGNGITVLSGVMDFSFKTAIKFNSSFVISATGNGATRTFNRGIVYITKET